LGRRNRDAPTVFYRRKKNFHFFQKIFFPFPDFFLRRKKLVAMLRAPKAKARASQACE
jgi:hypothetical protein